MTRTGRGGFLEEEGMDRERVRLLGGQESLSRGVEEGMKVLPVPQSETVRGGD